tara:strand:+ start:146 stop:865 length:720 start_codon:yes stop_codon:yes gene_type:complete
MDSDAVDSYTDTVESEEVAYIVRDTYYDMITNLQVPEHRKLVTLTAHGDVTTPTHMTIPDGVRSIEEVRYNTVISGDTAKDYTVISYVEPDYFMHTNLMRNSDDTTVTVVSIDGGEVLIRSDKAPEYYTSFDDTLMVFDSYDSGVDSTLQSSKFMVWAVEEPTFTMSDTFTPDLDVNLFPLLLNEVKSIAHVEMNQQANPKAEQMARRQRNKWQSDKHNVKNSDDNSYGRPDYGRKARR